MWRGTVLCLCWLSLCSAGPARAASPFPLAAGANVLSTNVWSFLIRSVIEHQDAAGLARMQYVTDSRVQTGLYVSALITQTWFSAGPSNSVITNSAVLTNWAIGYEMTAVTNSSGETNYVYPKVTNQVTGGITYELLGTIDAALFEMAPRYVDYRGSTNGGWNGYFQTPLSTNWVWNGARWVELTNGMAIDRYNYPQAPAFWTVSNMMRYIHAGTSIVYRTVTTNKTVLNYAGWQLGQYDVNGVTITNGQTTNYLNRALFTATPSNLRGTVLMTAMKAAVTQATTLVASGFGDTIDGAYVLHLVDSNGLVTWHHSLATNPCVIQQFSFNGFSLSTNGTETNFTMYDYSSAPFYDANDVGFYSTPAVGVGYWSTTNPALQAGITTVSNGWVGWSRAEAWEFYYESPLYDLAGENFEPTNVSPPEIRIAPGSLFPSNFAVTIQATGLYVSVAGSSTVPGAQGGLDPIARAQTSVLFTVTATTQAMPVAMYDFSSLTAPGGEYWDGGTNPTMAGASMAFVFTNTTPLYGTMHYISAAALNERWRFLEACRYTYRSLGFGTGTTYIGTYYTNMGGSIATCPGAHDAVVTAGTNSLRRHPDGSLVYDYDQLCHTVRYGPPAGAPHETYSYTESESLQWFDSVPVYTNLGTNLSGTAELFYGIRPRYTESVSIGSPVVSHALVHKRYVPVTDVYCSPATPYQYDSLIGVLDSELPVHKMDAKVKAIGATNLTFTIAPSKPTSSLRRESVHCSTTPSPGISDAAAHTVAQWGYTLTGPFVIMTWDFTDQSPSPP